MEHERTERKAVRKAKRQLEKAERDKFKYSMRDLIEETQAIKYLLAVIAVLLLVGIFIYAYG
jgi:hypothetical protein